MAQRDQRAGQDRREGEGGPASAPMWSTSKPPPIAPAAMATWNAATSKPPALSAWSGAARVIQVWNPTGNAPNAKPQAATATAVTTGERPASSRLAASSTMSAPPATMAWRSLRPAIQPPTRLPKKPPMP